MCWHGNVCARGTASDGSFALYPASREEEVDFDWLDKRTDAYVSEGEPQDLRLLMAMNPESQWLMPFFAR